MEGRIILKFILNDWEGVNRADLAQDREKKNVVSVVMNIWVPKNFWDVLVSEECLASQEGLYNVELFN